jgi:acid stress-induced BolA-like protein IbaG/YrbA
MNPDEIARLIQAGLPGAAEVTVRSGDNTHYEALVVSDSFAGKRAIARHQLIYGCLGSLMGNEIHAMSIRAYTPDEWRELAPQAPG